MSNQVPPMFVDRVIARVKEVERGKSKSSDKLMESWTSEIIALGDGSPPIVELDGRKYDLSAHDIRHYLMLEGDGLEQTSDAFNRLDLGQVNPESMDCKSREGFCYEMILKSTENQVTKPVKNPKTGKIEYEPVLDRNRKPIKTGWEFKPQNIKELLCKAEGTVAAGAGSDTKKPW